MEELVELQLLLQLRQLQQTGVLAGLSEMGMIKLVVVVRLLLEHLVAVQVEPLQALPVVAVAAVQEIPEPEVTVVPPQLVLGGLVVVEMVQQV
jgi:hypothetical protein